MGKLFKNEQKNQYSYGKSSFVIKTFYVIDAVAVGYNLGITLQWNIENNCYSSRFIVDSSWHLLPLS